MRTELINTLYRQSPPIFLGNTAVVSLSIFLLWNEVSHTHLLSWAAAIYVLTAIRIWLVWRDGKIAHTPATTARRAWVFVALSGVSGCLWGMMGVLFFSPDDTVVTAFTCIVLAGMMGGSVASLSSFWPAYYAYAIPTVLPFTARSLMHGDALFTVVAVLSLFLLVVNLAYSRNVQRIMRDAISLRFDNLDLIEQLTAEKERAELANRAKSQFLAAASHDLRQPTHALGLYITTLGVLTQAPTLDRSAIRNIADRLQTALGGMSGLLNVLLDISRLDAGAIEVAPSQFALQKEFDALENQFAQEAAAKGLMFRIRPTDIMLHTDAVLLHNMLSNLLSNALRYTARGKILVTARRRGARVEIRVIDTGIGIHSSQIKAIFREFYQIGNTVRGAERGLGLGLAIVARTAILVDAEVALRSTPGRGSVFSLALPGGPMPLGTVPVLPLVQPNQVKKTILVIDDDLQVLTSMQMLLLAWGHTVLTASSLAEAQSVTREHGDRFELILTDFRLAERVTGIDAVQAVWREADRTIPAIIITGDTSANGIKTAAASGFAVLHKPLDPQKMRALIDA